MAMFSLAILWISLVYAQKSRIVSKYEQNPALYQLAPSKTPRVCCVTSDQVSERFTIPLTSPSSSRCPESC